jgi:hypothetical protein
VRVPFPSASASEVSHTHSPLPEDAKSVREGRFIEVKGRARVGEIALTENEFKTSPWLGAEYSLYAVYHRAGTPQLLTIRDPARLDWRPVIPVEHYRVAPNVILEASSEAASR